MQGDKGKGDKAQGGKNGAAAGGDGAAANAADLREIEGRFKTANAMLTKKPESDACKSLVAEIQAELAAAKPTKAIPTSELQRELE